MEPFEGPGRYPPGSFFILFVLITLGGIVDLLFNIHEGKSILWSVVAMGTGLTGGVFMHLYIKKHYRDWR